MTKRTKAIVSFGGVAGCMTALAVDATVNGLNHRVVPLVGLWISVGVCWLLAGIAIRWSSDR